jgi:hypothetical protein
MISGFMIVKNVLKQGYPFVEAVAAALPICDEFLISEGYSTDGTFEIVERMTKLNSKIKMFREEWPTAKKWSILAEVTNSVRKKCKYDYILSIQANEVIHEESAEFIKSLPAIFPNVQSFSFPFWHLVQSFRLYEDYRLRFSKNLDGIVATGDAWSLGPSKSFVRKEALRSLKNPRTLIRYIGRGIQWTYANVCSNPTSRAIYLPKPIFRYWSLFPRNYLEKSKAHAELFDIVEYNKMIAALEPLVDKPAEFWKTVPNWAGFKLNYPEKFTTVSKSSHPKLVQDFIYNTTLSSYYAREEVLDIISGL